LSNIAPLLDRNRAFAADAAARQDVPALPTDGAELIYRFAAAAYSLFIAQLPDGLPTHSRLPSHRAVDCGLVKERL